MAGRALAVLLVATLVASAAAQTCPVRMVYDSVTKKCQCVEGADPARSCAVCLPGYGGYYCTKCVYPYVSSGGNLNGCYSCPARVAPRANLTGCGPDCLEGADPARSCAVCKPGYGGANCAKCVYPYVSPGGTLNPCYACPARIAPRANLTGCGPDCVEGADPAKSCAVCKPGYGGGNCAKCVYPLVSPGGTLNSCYACPARVAPRPDLTGCAATGGGIECLEGADPRQNCLVCLPGYGGTNCAKCVYPYVSPGGTLNPCYACPARIAPWANLTGCGPGCMEGADPAKSCAVCKPGYGGGNCAKCVYPYVSVGGTLNPCYACPARVAPRANLTGCGPECLGNADPAKGCNACKPGYGGANCDKCVAPLVSPGGTLNPCYACPARVVPWANQTGCGPECTPGAGPPGTCSGCLPGFGGPDCKPCVAPYISTGGSTAACRLCPGRQVPFANLTGCGCAEGAGPPGVCNVCKPGYGGLYCQRCTGNLQSPGGTLYNCGYCPVRMVVNAKNTGCDCVAGATPPGRCDRCLPGFGGWYCQRCTGNLQSPGGNLNNCGYCPVRMVVNTNNTGCDCVAGATPPGRCDRCLPGYGGGYCQRCTGNLQSPGGSLGGCGYCPVRTVVNANNTGCDCVAGATPPGRCDRCLPGYGGWYCQRCQGNTQSPGNNLNNCVTCPIRQVVAPNNTGCECVHGAMPAGLCNVCQPGHGGANCDPCDPGYYSPGGSLAVCQACPARQVPNDNQTACVCADGASPAANCSVCAAGHGGEDCAPCDYDLYSPGGSLAACQACPMRRVPTSNQSACACVEGADESPDCSVCKAGHGGPNCDPCDWGLYSPGGSLAACMACPARQVPNENQTACVCASEGSDPTRDCAVCLPGYGGEFCDICDIGLNSTGGSLAPCVTLPGNGYYDGGAQLCDYGYWSPGGSLSPCIYCGDGFNTSLGGASGTVAAVGADSADHCVTSAGWTPDGAGGVKPCIQGYYKSLLGPSACVKCPAATTTTLTMAATELSDCNACRPGFSNAAIDLTAPACTICPSGTFSFGYAPGGEECRPCPHPIGFSGTMVSRLGANNPDQCYPEFTTDGASTLQYDLIPMDPSVFKVTNNIDLAACQALCRSTAGCQYFQHQTLGPESSICYIRDKGVSAVDVNVEGTYVLFEIFDSVYVAYPGDPTDWASTGNNLATFAIWQLAKAACDKDTACVGIKSNGSQWRTFGAALTEGSVCKVRVAGDAVNPWVPLPLANT